MANDDTKSTGAGAPLCCHIVIEYFILIKRKKKSWDFAVHDVGWHTTLVYFHLRNWAENQKLSPIYLRDGQRAAKRWREKEREGEKSRAMDEEARRKSSNDSQHLSDECELFKSKKISNANSRQKVHAAILLCKNIEDVEQKDEWARERGGERERN